MSNKYAGPMRIGFAGGGLAQLAAQWAAVTWTGTQIRCVTFGAPPVDLLPFACIVPTILLGVAILHAASLPELAFEVACLPGSWHLIACQAEEAGRLAELTSWQIAKSYLTHAMVQVMNNRAGFAFQQFVDLPYTWAYNGSSLVNTVLRTTDNNTNPVSRLLIVLADSELLCTIQKAKLVNMFASRCQRPAKSQHRSYDGVAAVLRVMF